MIFFLILAIAVVADLVGGFYDAAKTAEGLSRGFAEGNAILGRRPSHLRVVTYNIAITAVFTIMAVLGWHYAIYALAGGGIGGLFANAGKHVIAGKNWVWLLRGGAAQPKQTVFQKIVG